MSSVIISDIHIGTNYKTCWYQQSVHEAYLVRVLDHVIQNANSGAAPITRLIILGDLFDFWTYPPARRPPTIDEIIAANPNVLGPDGKLRQVVEALDGNVIYLRGNHDIAVTQEDLDRIPTGDNTIELVDDVLVDDSGMVFTHGHLYTMFNAPDPRYPGEVPVGHFVTRAISYFLENTLPAGQTAASLPNQGSPYGFCLASMIPALARQLGNPSITDALLDYVAARCGMSETVPIVLADGSVTSIADAKTKYAGLWTEWMNANGGGAIGAAVAAKAAQADYDGTYMAWFAQKAAFTHSAAGIVMGHTHVPKSGIRNSSCIYVNGGFECPSIPDVERDSAHFNFTVVEQGTAAKLFQVSRTGDSYAIAAARAPLDQVVAAPFTDFSCYVRITNNSRHVLVKQAEAAWQGFYVVAPPDRIPANATMDLWIQDLPGAQGAAGSVTYSELDGSNPMQFVYGCPFGLASNYAYGGASFVASSPTPPDTSDSTYNTTPATGHPLFVEFFVERPKVVENHDGTGAGLAARAWVPTSALAQAVDAAGFRYDPEQDIIYSKMYPAQRELGYAYAYDAAAVTMSAVLDCEPIFFDYGGKTWMIELWKGQYGLETGCEIGVYYRAIGSSSPLYDLLDATVGRRAHDPNPSHNLFFECVDDSDRLVLSSVLYRDGQRLFSRGPQRHWWLTGFRWGVLSRPEDLTMDVSITCLSAEMRSALVNALRGMGYEDLSVSANTVGFTFDTPRSFQPRSEVPEVVVAVNVANAAIVAAYNAFGFPRNDPNVVASGADRLIASSVSIYSPAFFAEAACGLLRVADFGLSTSSLDALFARLYG
jgi:UDP-2,3-diacylglucosamine pyrophosphatase LpxH